ncbi:MAG: hypothetical protein V9G04_18700 [Nocardioides sp.]
MISLDQAVDATRTGDLWLFRGDTLADKAIRTATNAPVNHVGMALVLDDLPPMMWHAELGKSLLDLWTGDHHRGVQLHDLRGAVEKWTRELGQQAWVRQLAPEAGRAQEDGALRAIARWDGTSFPRTSALAWRWLRGRSVIEDDPRSRQERLESAYCAEVVGVTYEEMGLLARGRKSNWYDPGVFYSGDRLPLTQGWSLGDEIEVVLD